jgi:hypothetical protein
MAPALPLRGSRKQKTPVRNLFLHTTMTSAPRKIAAPLLAGLFLLLPACAGYGMADVLGDLGGLGMGRHLSGEIRSVDSRRQQIQITTSNRRSEVISYDSRTAVVYRQQRYPVSSLERGDYVAVRVREDSRGRLHADRIDVQAGARDRNGTAGRVGSRIQRYDGRVSRLNAQEGWFQMDMGRSGVYTVTLPYNPDRTTRDRFRRLRRGQDVRFEGELLNRNRVEIRRFL